MSTEQIKGYEVEQVLERLNAGIKVHATSYKQINDLRDKQVRILQEARTKVKPIAEWYKTHNFVFTHPDNNVRSPFGPVLGFDSKENFAIVWNLEKEFIEKVNLYSTDDRNFISDIKIIETGYFAQAMKGLNYLIDMLDVYNAGDREYIQKLEDEIKKID
jgi:hypothetical protein